MSSETKCALAVISWTRPQYLSAVIQSIPHAVGSADCDVWFFQDGGVTIEENEAVAQSLQLIESFDYSGTVYTEAAPKNIGCAMNYYKAFSLLDGGKYEYVFVISDDEVLAPDFVNTAVALQRRAEEDHELAITQQFSRWGAKLSQEEQEQVINNEAEWVCAQQEDNKGNFIAFTLSATAWKILKPTMDEWMERFMLPYADEEYPYMEARTPARCRLVREWYKEICPAWGHWKCVGVDGTLFVALHRLQGLRIAARLQRVHNIGEVGLHSSTRTYTGRGLDVNNIASLDSNLLCRVIKDRPIRAHLRWDYHE